MRTATSVGVVPVRARQQHALPVALSLDDFVAARMDVSNFQDGEAERPRAVASQGADELEQLDVVGVPVDVLTPAHPDSALAGGATDVELAVRRVRDQIHPGDVRQCSSPRRGVLPNDDFEVWPLQVHPLEARKVLKVHPLGSQFVDGHLFAERFAEQV